MKKKSKVTQINRKAPKKRGQRPKTRGPYTPPAKQAQIEVMRMEGATMEAIAKALGIDRHTVSKFCNAVAQSAEADAVRGLVVGMLRDAAMRVHIEIKDMTSPTGGALAMKALDNFAFMRPVPHVQQTQQGEMSQFDRDVQNMMQRLAACMLHKNRVYGLPDQEVLKEPETRYLELAPAAVKVKR